MTTQSMPRLLWKTPMRDLVRGRVTGRLDIDRLLEDAGLSGAAAAKVRAVVKRTRLWRLEKVDVAKELASHFIDGEEAGTPMNELLERFGDERRTARLIRKAKKRQRPVAWHVFAWARLSFGILIGVYVLSALYLLTGSPNVKKDYLAVLNRNASAVPADQAAWPLYREALLEMNLWEEREWDTPIPYYAELPESAREEVAPHYYAPPYVFKRWERLEKSLRPGDPGWDATVAFLHEHADSIDLIRRGGAMPNLGLEVGFQIDYSAQDRRAVGMEVDPEFLAAQQGMTFRDPDRALIGVLLPHLSPMRRLGQLLAADALRAASEGDGPTAIQDVTAILGLGDQTDEHPLLINGLVCLATRNVGYRAAQDILLRYADLWTDAQLRDLAHALAKIEDSHEAWFEGERLWFYDYLQRTYTDNGEGGGQITSEGIRDFGQYNDSRSPSEAVAIAGLPAAAVLIAPRDEMKRKYDELMDRAVLEGNRPLWEYDPEASVDAEIERMYASVMERLRYVPITIFMPASGGVSRTVQNDAGARDGVMIGIALELYRRRHGDWPATLDELTPGFLPDVPVDRLTGKPLRYVVTGDGPVVYSLGVDGDDDGGRPPLDGDKVKNTNASPRQFNGQPRGEVEHDGDWVLWPMPVDER